MALFCWNPTLARSPASHLSCWPDVGHTCSPSARQEEAGMVVHVWSSRLTWTTYWVWGMSGSETSWKQIIAKGPSKNQLSLRSSGVNTHSSSKLEHNDSRFCFVPQWSGGHGAAHSCSTDARPGSSVDKELRSPGSGQTKARTVK